MKKPKNVEEYIASVPREHRKMAEELRAAIKEAAPQAEEKISYGMPYYHCKGRLAYFRLAKGHLGLYIPPPIVAEHKKELAGYVAFNATIQLPLEKKLPLALIRKMVKARAKMNESR